MSMADKTGADSRALRTRAKHYCGILARKGDPGMQYNYALLLLRAEGHHFGETNVLGHSAYPRALYWLRKAQSQGDEEAAKKVADLEERLSKECFCCKKSKESVKLNRCSQCKAAYYCGRECLAKHWKMGHKADCNSVKNP